MPITGYRDQVGAPPNKGRGPLRDIRKFIAQLQTPALDPNQFPRVEYQRYPLMPLNAGRQPYKDAAGRSIVLYGPEDEEAFYRDHPDAVRVQDPVDRETELRNLREENARLRGEQSGDDRKNNTPLEVAPAPGGESQGDPRPSASTVAGLTKGTKPRKPAGPVPGSKLG